MRWQYMPSVLLINFSGLVTESWSSQILISKNTICLTSSLVIWRLSVCQNSSSFFLVANQVKAWVLWEAPKVIFIKKDRVDVCVISCLGQINRWHCHSVSQWFTKTKTKTKAKTKATYVLKRGSGLGVLNFQNESKKNFFKPTFSVISDILSPKCTASLVQGIKLWNQWWQFEQCKSIL